MMMGIFSLKGTDDERNSQSNKYRLSLSSGFNLALDVFSLLAPINFERNPFYKLGGKTHSCIFAG